MLRIYNDQYSELFQQVFLFQKNEINLQNRLYIRVSHNPLAHRTRIMEHLVDISALSSVNEEGICGCVPAEVPDHGVGHEAWRLGQPGQDEAVGIFYTATT